jgi:hypothetical protein
MARSVHVIALLCCMVSYGVAEEPPAMPEPTKHHEALDVWVGSWTGSGEMMEGPFGPGGPMEWTEECSWFGGSRFHVVCESEGSSPMGETTGLGIIGYDTEKEVYTHYGIDSNGWTGHSKGTLSGNTWTFKSKEIMGGETFYTRMTMTMQSATKTSFKWEMSQDGETWTTVMKGTTEKQ